MPETQTKPKDNLVPLRTASIDSLLASGANEADVITEIRRRGEEKNRAAQANLPAPPAQPDPDWAARKAWLLDGQAIHGELKEFFWPALAALQADDQAVYSQQRDLLFKALRTFLGDPPPVIEIPEVPPVIDVTEEGKL